LAQEEVASEVTLIIPMLPNMELAAAHTASILAKLMDFEEDRIDEIKLALIESCINAFEHSHSKDQKVYIQFTMKKDEIELRINFEQTPLINSIGMSILFEIVEKLRELEGTLYFCCLKPAIARTFNIILDVQVFGYAAFRTSLTRYFKVGVGSSRPKSRPTICLLELLSLKTS